MCGGRRLFPAILFDIGALPEPAAHSFELSSSSFYVDVGIKTPRSSCWQGKHFAHWASLRPQNLMEDFLDRLQRISWEWMEFCTCSHPPFLSLSNLITEIENIANFHRSAGEALWLLSDLGIKKGPILNTHKPVRSCQTGKKPEFHPLWVAARKWENAHYTRIPSEDLAALFGLNSPPQKEPGQLKPHSKQTTGKVQRGKWRR